MHNSAHWGQTPLRGIVAMGSVPSEQAVWVEGAVQKAKENPRSETEGFLSKLIQLLTYLSAAVVNTTTSVITSKSSAAVFTNTFCSYFVDVALTSLRSPALTVILLPV